MQFELGKRVTFEASQTVSLTYSGGDSYELQAVVAVTKLDDGAWIFERHNDGYIEVPKGYLFIEIGEANGED